MENKKYFSNEINVTSHSDSPLQWILGLFQYQEKFSQPVNVQDNAQASQPQVFGGACPAGVGCLASPYNGTVTGLAAPNPNNNFYYASRTCTTIRMRHSHRPTGNFSPTWKLTTGVALHGRLSGRQQYVRELCFGIPSCLAFPNTLAPGTNIRRLYAGQRHHRDSRSPMVRTAASPSCPDSTRMATGGADSAISGMP